MYVDQVTFHSSDVSSTDSSDVRQFGCQILTFDIISSNLNKFNGKLEKNSKYLKKKKWDKQSFVWITFFRNLFEYQLFSQFLSISGNQFSGQVVIQ